ncbi:MAG: NADH-quinone oxidoreductase subunit J [Chloroflexi bacterium]|nr:NADH-quinone oxidoreductase subunit J [Chloroflexota bacterium]
MDLTALYTTIAFYVFALAAVVSGAAMIVSRNMVRSALWLVATLGSVAALYLLLSADFLAVSQVLVYIGAIMILMLFAIMLTPGQVDIPTQARGQQVAAGIVAAAIFGISVSVVLSHDWKLRPDVFDLPTTWLLGTLLFSTYVLPLMIAALLLTAAMIGALVIARED